MHFVLIICIYVTRNFTCIKFTFNSVWGDDEPDNSSEENDCMCIQGSSTKAVDCEYMASGVICHRIAMVHTEVCPRNWYFYDGQCYSIVPEKLSHPAAKEKCEELGAEMATANSLEESVSNSVCTP